MSAVVLESYPEMRRMELLDFNEIMSIENRVYEFPWSRTIFADCLNSGYVCRVFDENDTVLGYGIMSVGAGECHILNLCIHPDRQRCGLGSHLLLHLLDEARRNRARMAFLEVRYSNQMAFRLYSRLGFDEIGTRKSYYPARKGREDAIILAMMI